jgi:hypothetical protein
MHLNVPKAERQTPFFQMGAEVGLSGYAVTEIFNVNEA